MLIAVIAGVLVIGSVIWYRDHYSPNKLVNIRKPVHRRSPANPSSISARKSRPIPTPPRPEIDSLSGNQIAMLQTLCKQFRQENDKLSKEMLPFAQRLLGKDPDLVLRRKEDPQWFYIQYERTLKDYRENRNNLPFLLPQSFQDLSDLMEEAEEKFLEGMKPFDPSSSKLKSFPPKDLRRLKELFSKIEEACQNLEKELESVSDIYKIR